MKQKKVAGVDRPYTTEDLGRILYDFIKNGDWENKACLDYYIPEHYDVEEIRSENFHIYSITEFGSNEGIYTYFYIEVRDTKEKYSLLTAKTLCASNESFAKMHEMAACICCKFGLFVYDNPNKFEWSGYDVSYVNSDGREILSYWCGSMERVANVADRLREEHGNIKIYYVDKSTREKFEYAP